MVQQGAAEVEDGARAQFAPAHTRPLHALLDEMFGCRLHSAGADGQALVTVRRVPHPLSVGAEIATFCVERLRSFIGRSATSRQYAQQGVWPLLPEHILGVVHPCRRLWCFRTVQGGANRPEVLATVIPIQNLHPLAAEGGRHMLPDPLGAIAQDDDTPQDRLLTTTVAVHTAPANDLQRPTPPAFRPQPRCE